jgi:hypothetical protein
VNHDAVGIRDIDNAALPDRYARSRTGREGQPSR